VGALTQTDVLLTPEVLLSFPNLFRPKPAKPGKEPKYGCALIFNKAAQESPQFKAMVEAANAALAERGWQKGSDKRPANLKTPFNPCNKNDYHKIHGEDSVFINVTSTSRPGIVDQNVQPIIDESRIYPGCFVRAEVRAFTYDNESKGVSFGLNNIQFVRDGDPLGNRKRAEDVFGAVGGGAEGETGGGSAEASASASADSLL